MIFKEGARPIKVEKITYFKDKSFKSRLLPALDVPKIDIKRSAPPVFDICALKEDDNMEKEDIETRVMAALEY